MRRILLQSWLLFTALLLSSFIYAQTSITKGVVLDENNHPLPGVNILIKGTTNGTISDFDGNFSLNDAIGKTLILSYIGYQSQEIVATSTMKVVLVEDAEQLNEVVVTALGIEREERSLGYAVQGVKKEDMDAGSATGNMMNSLSGKVAGVQISPSAGAGSASRVVIRGNAVLSGNNQPLYVIDGVPISNERFRDGSDGSDSDVSTGDGLSSLNPDDIAEISVLKGGSATALYGTRAINGVVLITTKSGKGKKAGVDFSQSISLDFLGITPNEQQQYGAGSLGDITGDPRSALSMWGPKITGQENDFYFDGETRNLRTYNNYKNLYKTGVTSNTAVSAYASNETGDIRISYSNMDNSGMIENSYYKRNTFSIKGSQKVTDKLKIEGRANYTNQYAHNRMTMGSSVFNYNSQLLGIPNTIDVRWLRDYKDEDGFPIGYDDRGSNPYWDMYENYNKDELNRIVAMAAATYEITPDLKFMARTGVDYGVLEMNVKNQLNSAWHGQGRMFQRNNREMEINSDFLLSYNKKVGKFDFNVNAGGSHMSVKRHASDVGSTEFESQEDMSLSTGKSIFIENRAFERAISSLYATGSIGYNGYLFLDASVRNDWSSTLPLDNNSFLYPSISGTWIFSDMDWDTPEWLSFGKLRASWAQVGSDTDPYQLANQYTIDRWMINDLSYGRLDNNTIPNTRLLPSIQTSYEFGIDLRFFNDRFGLDVAHYKSTANNQILPVDISSTSGFDRVMINAGEILNTGWEMALNIKPIMKENFTWDININAAHNYNEVVSLTEGVEFFALSSMVQAIPGQPYGQIVGRKALRGNNGELVVNNEGQVQVTDAPEIIGNGVQPWMAGIRNSFNYKNISFSFLIDGKFGGDIYSSTNAAMYGNGKHVDTIEGREEWNKGDGFWNPGNLVIANEDGTFTPFEGNVNPQLYYGSMPTEMFMYDASFIKLREINLSYRLPKAWMDNMFVKNVNLTASAFNVGYLWKSSENFDPEATFTSGNAQGVESATLSVPRTFIFKLNANF